VGKDAGALCGVALDDEVVALGTEAGSRSHYVHLHGNVVRPGAWAAQWSPEPGLACDRRPPFMGQPGPRLVAVSGRRLDGLAS
jgi:hypothetical protein